MNFFFEYFYSLPENKTKVPGPQDSKKYNTMQGKRRKDPNAPKKPYSAYFLFAQEVREDVKRENPDERITVISMKIAEKWKGLSEEQKKPFELRAQEDKKRYQAEMAAYTPPDLDDDDVPKNATNVATPVQPSLFFQQGNVKIERAEEDKNNNGKKGTVFMFGHKVDLDADDLSDDDKLYNVEDDSENDDEEDSEEDDDSEEDEKDEDDDDGSGGSESDDESDEEAKPQPKSLPSKELKPPQRARSAFMIFVAQERQNVSRSHPKLSIMEISRKLGCMWKEMSEEDKQVYRKQAEQEVQKYAAAREEFKKQGGELNAKPFTPKAKPAKVAKDVKRKKPKKENKIRPPKTAYFIYSQKNLSRLRNENPDMAFGERLRLLATNWQGLSESEKAEYEREAQQEREAYQKKMAEQEKEAPNANPPQKEAYQKKTNEGKARPVAKWQQKKTKKKQKESDDEEDSDDEKPKKKKQTEKKKKDPNAPKRPATAYIFYSKEKREELKRNNPSLSFTELGKKLGEMWRGASEEEKAPFAAMAEKDKERYKRELAAYESSKEN